MMLEESRHTRQTCPLGGRWHFARSKPFSSSPFNCSKSVKLFNFQICYSDVVDYVTNSVKLGFCEMSPQLSESMQSLNY